ncbi:hypothetical protein [Loktanella atrilutea]|uniref:hypothetical protein n=1 Tax=Loktanella atrilutea TaxID=366533 RepID=UPI001160DE7B|nr:hypothetical protein [Loktanella atrilutea]
MQMEHLIALIFVITSVVGSFMAPGASYAAMSDVTLVKPVSSVVLIDDCDQNAALTRDDSVPCQKTCSVPCTAGSAGFFLSPSNLLTFIRPAQNRFERTAENTFSGIVLAVDLSPPRRIFVATKIVCKI